MTVRLAYEEHGPRDAPAIVLLHGFPLSRAMWSEQVEALRTSNFRIVLPDLRGHGKSPVVAEASTMERCASDVIRHADALGLDRFVLGGFSLGGYVALEIARRHPDRLLGLALIDTRAEPDTEEARRKRFETAESVRREGISVLERAMLPKLLTESTRRRRPDLAEKVRKMILATPAEGAARALEGMAERPDQRPNLSRLGMPVFVAVGERDELTPPDASREMARLLPHAKLTILPDAAHLAPLEAAAALNPAFKSWLEATLRSTGSPSTTVRSRSAG